MIFPESASSVPPKITLGAAVGMYQQFFVLSFDLFARNNHVSQAIYRSKQTSQPAWLLRNELAEAVFTCTRNLPKSGYAAIERVPQPRGLPLSPMCALARVGDAGDVLAAGDAACAGGKRAQGRGDAVPSAARRHSPRARRLLERHHPRPRARQHAPAAQARSARGGRHLRVLRPAVHAPAPRRAGTRRERHKGTLACWCTSRAPPLNEWSWPMVIFLSRFRSSLVGAQQLWWIVLVVHAAGSFSRRSQRHRIVQPPVL